MHLMVVKKEYISVAICLNDKRYIYVIIPLALLVVYAIIWRPKSLQLQFTINKERLSISKGGLDHLESVLHNRNLLHYRNETIMTMETFQTNSKIVLDRAAATTITCFPENFLSLQQLILIASILASHAFGLGGCKELYVLHFMVQK